MNAIDLDKISENQEESSDQSGDDQWSENSHDETLSMSLVISKQIEKVEVANQENYEKPEPDKEGSSEHDDDDLDDSMSCHSQIQVQFYEESLQSIDNSVISDAD